MKYFSILIFLLLTSCFFMPPGVPHGHIYKAVDGSERCISVFCTPHNKTFVLKTKEAYEVKICSKTIIDSCGIMEHKEFFETEAYQKHIRINDRKFHKLFYTDTLTLTNNLTGEKIYFKPIIE